jgi:predicted transcriptional regulator
MKLEKMENITGYVIENMRYNLVLMENMSATLAHSGAVLGDLIRETRDISGEEKKKISQAISEIEAARKLLEEERRNALQLFEEINSAEYE